MNPEDKVVSAIDELVDWQLDKSTHGSYDERCSICSSNWHGLSNDHCPGAFATEEQIDTRLKERIRELMSILDRTARATNRTMGQAIRCAFDPGVLPDKVMDAADGEEALSMILQDEAAMKNLRQKAFYVDGYHRSPTDVMVQRLLCGGDPLEGTS